MSRQNSDFWFGEGHANIFYTPDKGRAWSELGLPTPSGDLSLRTWIPIMALAPFPSRKQTRQTLSGAAFLSTDYLHLLYR